MSQSVAEFVDGVDGVRGGVADAVSQRFATVTELSQSDAQALTEVKGVGQVLADRILDAARSAVASADTPAPEPAPEPATRAKAVADQARDAARPALDVIAGGVDEVTDPTATDRDAASDEDLSPFVERLASLVGHTIGWGIRLVRSVTAPVHQLLRR